MNLSKFALNPDKPASGKNLDWDRIYEIFESYDFIRFKDEPRGKFYVIDLSDEDRKRLFIGNLIIRKPHKVQGKNLIKWEDLPL